MSYVISGIEFIYVLLHMGLVRGDCPANTGHSPNAVLMLGQRRRRCANIETALGVC